jgi:hypothetical protein
MAQIIKHRRGSIQNIGSISFNSGELVIGSGSIDTLNGPVAFIGDPASGAYRPIPQIYSGSTAPTVTSSYFNGISFYATSDKNLYVLQSGGNLRLDLAGGVSGSAITPSSITTLGNISASTGYFTSTVHIDGTTTLGNVTASNMYVTGTLGVSGLTTEGTVSASYLYLSNNATIVGNTIISGTLGVSGLTTEGTLSASSIYVTNGISASTAQFVSATGSFSGSFAGPITGTASYATTSSFALVAFSSSYAASASNAISGGYAVYSTTASYAVAATTASYAIAATSGAYAVNATSASFASTASSVNVLYQTVTITGSLLAQTGSFGTLTTSGDVTIGGNLTVNGGTTIVSSSTVDIGNSTILLNYNAAANQAAGIYAIDNTAPLYGTGSFLYNPTSNYWMAGLSGSEQRIVRQASGTQLTAYTLTYADAISGSLSSLPDPHTPTTTVGDSFPVFVSSSHTWYMTNTIDGGTF